MDVTVAVEHAAIVVVVLTSAISPTVFMPTATVAKVYTSRAGLSGIDRTGPPQVRLTDA